MLIIKITTRYNFFNQIFEKTIKFLSVLVKIKFFLARTFSNNKLKKNTTKGALICGTTPWGYLQIYPEKTLNDMKMYIFLQDYFGIIFTENTLYLSEEMDVSSNETENEPFDHENEKVSTKPKNIKKIENHYNEPENINFFYKEIIKGLEKVPTPSYPGSIICTGNSQAVLTSETGDVFVACSKYGKIIFKGKVSLFKNFTIPS